MPGFEHKEGFIGVKSVSEGKVFLKEFPAGIYPACIRHGAILCVATSEKGKIWRCRELGCDEGCYEKLNQK